MNEIKCPHCGEVFQVDEAGYAAIVKQVHDEEFSKDINSRLEEVKNNLNIEHQAQLKTQELEICLK